MTNTLKTTLLLALCCVFVGLAGVSHATGCNNIFCDNYEAYSVAGLSGQGSWSASGWNVVSSPTHSGSRAIYCNNYSSGGCRSYKIGTPTTSGTGSMWVYIDPSNTTGGNRINDFLIESSTHSYYCGYFGVGSLTGMSNWQLLGTGDSAMSPAVVVSTGVWHLISWTWDSSKHIYIYLDGVGNGVAYNCTGSTFYAPDKFHSDTENCASGCKFWDDDLADYITPPTTLQATDPASGTTLTNTSGNLTLTWTQIDPTIWTKIYATFNDNTIGESSALQTCNITTLNGSCTMPFSGFNFVKNGTWNLQAVVENAKDIDFAIPNPTYNIILNIGGLPTPYTFSNTFDSWYSSNVSEYTAPSAWAEAMTGFLEPIFIKIGEFGNRVNSYLDTNLAYQRGNSIGSVFPVALAYISKINLFFGGFPIAEFFEWGIIAMVGIFAVKVILKLLSFIPFFGGGG